MSQQVGTGKYERLLARCQGLEPVPTAVAHPCEATALSGAVEAAQRGLIRATAGWTGCQDQGNCSLSRDRSRRSRNRRCAAQPCVGRKSRRTGQRRPG